MGGFAEMNIFFIVTTIAVIVVGLLAALVLYRAWRILKTIERITESVAGETELLRSDIAAVRRLFRSQVRSRVVRRVFRALAALWGA